MEQNIKMDKQLGAKMKQLRTSKGYTQDIVAARLQIDNCDISRGTYAKIEAGIRHVSIGELRAICKVLGTTLSAFFAEWD